MTARPRVTTATPPATTTWSARRAARRATSRRALPAELIDQLTGRTGYAISRYDLQFHGLCPMLSDSANNPTTIRRKSNG